MTQHPRQARADAGEEGARVATGPYPADVNDSTPSALVEMVHKHEARVSALRARLKELDEEEDVTRARLQKARPAIVPGNSARQ